MQGLMQCWCRADFQGEEKSLEDHGVVDTECGGKIVSYEIHKEVLGDGTISVGTLMTTVARLKMKQSMCKLDRILKHVKHRKGLDFINELQVCMLENSMQKIVGSQFSVTISDKSEDGVRLVNAGVYLGKERQPVPFR